MSTPIVDVIIAVHSANRPIARAVASILHHTKAPVRVIVVAHNIESAIIREQLGSFASHPQLRLLSYKDDFPSPAGPMNHGLSHSTAPFICLLGSDDEFCPGAIDSWLNIQSETNAEVVISRIIFDDGRIDPYPPTRWGHRSRRLDGVKDRLPYRSAPLGLVSRNHFSHLRLTEELLSGEDLAYSLTLWFTANHIAYDLSNFGYLIRDDAEDRVTHTARSVDLDFAFVDAIEELPWFQAANMAVRTAITVKLIRIHFFDAMKARLFSELDLDTLREPLRSISERILELSPVAKKLLSRADIAVLELLRSSNSTFQEVSAALNARRRYFSLAALVTQDPLRIFHRQAPLRTLAAGYLAQRIK